MDIEREFTKPCSVTTASGGALVAGSSLLAPRETPAV